MYENNYLDIQTYMCFIIPFLDVNECKNSSYNYDNANCTNTNGTWDVTCRNGFIPSTNQTIFDKSCSGKFIFIKMVILHKLKLYVICIYTQDMPIIIFKFLNHIYLVLSFIHLGLNLPGN